MIQLLLSYLRTVGTIGHAFEFNSNVEGSSVKHFLQLITNLVDVLKLRFTQYQRFCNGLAQQDVSGCILIIIYVDIINKDSVPYSGSNNNFTGVSVSDFLFSFILEKYTVSAIFGLRSPILIQQCVIYYTYLTALPCRN